MGYRLPVVRASLAQGVAQRDEGREELFTLLVQELVARQVPAPSLVASIVLFHQNGIHEAAERMEIAIAEAMHKAEARHHNEIVMNTAWASLKPRLPVSQLELPFLYPASRRKSRRPTA